MPESRAWLWVSSAPRDKAACAAGLCLHSPCPEPDALGAIHPGQQGAKWISLLQVCTTLGQGVALLFRPQGWAKGRSWVIDSFPGEKENLIQKEEGARVPGCQEKEPTLSPNSPREATNQGYPLAAWVWLQREPGVGRWTERAWGGPPRRAPLTWGA